MSVETGAVHGAVTLCARCATRMTLLAVQQKLIVMLLVPSGVLQMTVHFTAVKPVQSATKVNCTIALTNQCATALAVNGAVLIAQPSARLVLVNPPGVASHRVTVLHPRVNGAALQQTAGAPIHALYAIATTFQNAATSLRVLKALASGV